MARDDSASAYAEFSRFNFLLEGITMRSFKIHFLAITAAMATMLLGFTPSAYAVPSFARQTGMACAACHTTFPQLTEFGRSFKLNGYILTGMHQIESGQGQGTSAPQLKINEVPPLSAMFMTSVSNMSKPLQDPGDGSNTQNGNVEFPQQLSFFFAGEISEHMGVFSQITYTHDSDHFSIDNTDFRYAKHGKFGDADAIYGLTINNNPTVEDVYQGTPAWGFPFISSPITPGPIAATQIDGTLAQEVAGIGGYTFIANHWYLGATLYRSEHGGVTQPFGASATNTIKGLAPYWRLAYHNDFGSNDFEIGIYGISANITPEGVTGATDKYVDNAIDAYFEHPFGSDSIVFRGTYIHEKATFDASQPLGLVSNSSDNLNTFKVNGEYHFKSNKALALGAFRTTGSSDALRYKASPDPLTSPPTCGVGTGIGCDPAPGFGSANGSPDTTGWILQGTYLPWQNVQLGLQYTWYTKFNGSSDNYDGLGRKASDNNTLFGYAWFMW
ncbi:hypothetical protein [Sulfuricaulis sp.]|uniref:hypothetical protein n=1 Tax=Sulfuricaulis sp. TaxID=2003553 RepID=UPI00355ABE8C